MILPTKHMATHRALLGIGANFLRALSTPKTMSALWDEIRAGDGQETPTAVVDYKWFVLAVDLLFILGVVDLDDGVLRRSSA